MEKTKVLMIDDNESLVEMVKEYFKNNDSINIVLSANDGEEGIKKIVDNQDKYDVILLDLLMPKKDGLYVLEQMKLLEINKPVIVATSYHSVDAINEVASYGVNYKDLVRAFCGKSQIAKLRKVLTFKFKKHKLYNLSDSRLELLNNMTIERAKELISEIEKTVNKN